MFANGALDLRFPEAQNWTAEPSFDEALPVAKLDVLENRLATMIKIAAFAVPVLLGWLGVGTYFLFMLHGDIQAIKQNAKDRGNDIVRNIETPASSAQLAANLALAGAQLQVARSEGRNPDPKKLEALQNAIANASQTHPEIPESWQAAVQLVNYKYRPQSTPALPLQNCLDMAIPGANVDRLYGLTPGGTAVTDVPGFTDAQAPHWMSHAVLGNCALSLDDDGSFPSSSVGKFFEEVKKHHPNADQFVLVLTNAHITYSGGKLLPVSEIQFKDCSFEFRPPTEIPGKGSQLVMSQLLRANVSEGTLQLPTRT